jgi:hypothetical protein
LIKDAFHSSITNFRHRTTVLVGVLNSTPQYPQGAAKVSNFLPPSNLRCDRFAHGFNKETPPPENLHVLFLFVPN